MISPRFEDADEADRRENDREDQSHIHSEPEQPGPPTDEHEPQRACDKRRHADVSGRETQKH